MRNLNKNDQRRLKLIGPFLLENAVKSFEKYDIAHFDGLDADSLLQLISEGFVDIEETQNDSPSIKEFLAFMYQEKQLVTCHGYIVSPSREDYRISIEGLYRPEQFTSRDNKISFVNFCKGADELDVEGNLRSWWD